MNKLSLPSVIETAKRYAARGWYVFPVHSVVEDGGKLCCTCGRRQCSAIGKHPLHRSWENEATIDPKKIETLFAPIAGVSPNIAIATGRLSGLTVIDVDIDKGGLDSWNSIKEEIDVPDTFWVHTGSGGFHFYFNYNPAYKTKTNALGSGIDIRNDGGYIIAPPSLHKSGGQYTAPAPDQQLADIPVEMSKYTHTVQPKQQGNLSAKKAEAFLQYIDSNDYNTFLTVGVILGRAFQQSEEGFQLFQKWCDKDYNKSDKGTAKRAQKISNVYFDASRQESSSGNSVGIGTLIKMAKDNGYSDIDESQRVSITNFCYFAPENSYLFLSTGELWKEQGINSAIAPVIEDGQSVKASQWLRDHKLVSHITYNCDLPTGIIAGYLCQDGTPVPCRGHRCANLYSVDKSVKPLPQSICNESLFSEIEEEEENVIEEPKHIARKPMKPIKVTPVYKVPAKKMKQQKEEEVTKAVFDCPAWMLEEMAAPAQQQAKAPAPVKVAAASQKPAPVSAYKPKHKDGAVFDCPAWMLEEMAAPTQPQTKAPASAYKPKHKDGAVFDCPAWMLEEMKK